MFQRESDWKIDNGCPKFGNSFPVLKLSFSGDITTTLRLEHKYLEKETSYRQTKEKI